MRLEEPYKNPRWLPTGISISAVDAFRSRRSLLFPALLPAWRTDARYLPYTTKLSEQVLSSKSTTAFNLLFFLVLTRNPLAPFRCLAVPRSSCGTALLLVLQVRRPRLWAFTRDSVFWRSTGITQHMQTTWRFWSTSQPTGPDNRKHWYEHRPQRRCINSCPSPVLLCSLFTKTNISAKVLV